MDNIKEVRVDPARGCITGDFGTYTLTDTGWAYTRQDGTLDDSRHPSIGEVLREMARDADAWAEAERS